MKIFFTLSLVCFLSLLGHAQSKHVNDVGNSGLLSFLNDIPKKYLKEHGFNTTEEFNIAKIGAQYEIMALGKNGKLTPTQHYYLIVTVNNENRAVLTVGEIDGKLDIQGIGYTNLAKELQPIEASYRLNDKANIMVIDYLNKAGYVSTISSPILEHTDFVPLESAKMFFTENNVRLKSSFKLSELRQINTTINP